MIMQLEHISKSFGGRQLFHDVTFRLEEYERLALVGPNGAGKTTMLNIISGAEDPDEGRVLFAKGARVGYLEQEAIEMADQPIFEEVMSSQVEVLEAERRLHKLEAELGEAPTPQQLAAAGRARDAYEVLGGYTIEAKVRSVMFGLGFKEGDLSRCTTEFSGGWQMRIALAKLLIRNPEVLLLDEPTNHLDLESVKWLEGFLRGYAGTVIVVSHDRAFMDNMVDRVAEVDNGQVNLYKGNYSAYLRTREERLERLRAEAAKQAEEIAHMEAFIEKFRYKATKSKQVQDRVKKLEKIKRVELPEEKKTVKFNFKQPPRTGDEVVRARGLVKRYGDKAVYDGFDFTMYRGDKIALVGPNGAGKSTLLKMIAGAIEPDAGTIEYGVHVSKTYYAQHQLEELHPGNTVFEELDRVAPGWSVSQVRTLLGAFLFTGDAVDKRVSVLSGGEKSRLALAKMLVAPRPLLCLDEPTNHLDIESIQWLEDYLKNYSGAVLLISHDRAFLDNVTNRTIELSLGKATDYKVSYSKYVVLRAERRAQQMAAYENQQRMIEKTEEFIEKFRYKPTKSNQVQSRIKQLERLERLEVEEEDLATLNIKFPPAPRSGQIVAEINEAGMSFGAKHVFSGANFIIGKGDKIALVGRNGEGKTTLARMLVGQLTPTEGSVRLGANVNIGYYAQNQDDLMDGEFTVYDTLDRVAVGDIRTRLRDILGAFLFRGEDIDKKVKVLSGGERARLAMARMMLEPRNLLVLDEPTNHMDMRSKDILKNAIMKYDGTVVVVSHDREFLDGMVQKVYEFRDGGVKEYLGGIYYFLEKRKLESLREIERREAPQKPAVQAAPNPGAAVSGKLTYEQRKEQEKQLRKLRRAVEGIEAELAAIEKQIAAYDAKFAVATTYDEADYKAYNDLKARYDHQMHEWEKASYELELTEEQ